MNRTVVGVLCLAGCGICVGLQQQEEVERPFSRLEREAQRQFGKWAGDHRILSRLLQEERKRLGARFEPELLKFLGDDIMKHRKIAVYLSTSEYLHGAKPLPHLALLILHQGIDLCKRKGDIESQGHLVSFGVNAAILSEGMGFRHLAVSHKNTVESLISAKPILVGGWPAMPETDRKVYEQIPGGRKRPASRTAHTSPSTSPSSGQTQIPMIVVPTPPPDWD